MLGSNRARAFEREKKGRGLPQSFFLKSDRNSFSLEAPFAKAEAAETVRKGLW